MNYTDYTTNNMPAKAKTDYDRHHRRRHHHLHDTRQMLNEFLHINLVTTTATSCIDETSQSSVYCDGEHKITMLSCRSRDAFKSSNSCASNLINCEKNLPPRMPSRGRLIINDTDLDDDDDGDIIPSQTSMTSIINNVRNKLINDSNDTNAVKLQPSFDNLLNQPQDRWLRKEESDKNQKLTSTPFTATATEVLNATYKTIDVRPMIPTRRCSNHFGSVPDHHYFSYDESNQLGQEDSPSDTTATREMSVKDTMCDVDDDDNSFVSALTEHSSDFLRDQIYQL